MASDITFHVPPESSPDNLLPLLEAMYLDGHKFDTVGALLDFAKERGLSPRTEMQIFANTAGLLARNDDGHIVLSENAKAIMQLKSEVWADLIHYLLYVGWDPNYPVENTALWSYREVTNALWNKPSGDVVSIAHQIVEEINNCTQQTFTGLPGYDPGKVSFSDKSIRGVRKWIEALTPPIIESNNFARRHFCPPELALMAVGWVGQTMNGEIGIDFLLTPDRREVICRLCLLDPSALDHVLDWMLPLYRSVVRPGTSAGVYGRFVHFVKWPELSDLVPPR